MSYVKILDKTIVSAQDILNENINVSLPSVIWTDEILNPLGYAVLNSAREEIFPLRYQYIIDGEPEFVDGKWYKTYQLVEHSQFEKEQIDGNQQKFVRDYRNELLKQSDWTQVADIPFSNDKKAEWVEYRQSLRDVTSQIGFPWSVEWPSPPAQ